MVLSFYLIKPLITDERVHMHFIHLIGNGYTPFVDFWDHHFPLLWYVFAIIKLAPGILGKVFVARVIQTLIWVLAFYFLDKATKVKYSLGISILLMSVSLFPHFDFFELRPEFLCLPLITYIIYFSGLDKPNPKQIILVLLGCAIAIFTTPRIYFFLIPLGMLLWVREGFLQTFRYAIPAILVLIAFLFIFDWQDLYFFVFFINTKWSCDHPVIWGTVWFSLLAINFIFFLVTLYFKDWFKASLYIALFITLWLESSPFPSQSTLFMNTLSIYVGLTLLQRVKFIALQWHYPLLFGMSVIVFIILMPFHHKFLFKYGFLFHELPVYEKSYKELKGKYFHLEGFGFRSRFLDGYTEPLFHNGYSYFGFYQDCILDNQYKAIIDYNRKRGRDITYFKSDKPVIHIDDSIKGTIEKMKSYVNQQ